VASAALASRCSGKPLASAAAMTLENSRRDRFMALSSRVESFLDAINSVAGYARIYWAIAIKWG
jgi:hypothetical protein